VLALANVTSDRTTLAVVAGIWGRVLAASGSGVGEIKSRQDLSTSAEME
jgi:hypothetical protein